MKFELNSIDDFTIRDGNKLVCSATNGSLEISFLQNGILYVTCSFNSLNTPSALAYVNTVLKGQMQKSNKAPSLKVNELYAVAQLDDIVVNVQKNNGNIQVFHKGKSIFGGPLGTSDTVIPRTQIRAFKRDGDKSWFCRINDPLDDRTRFFGMGDKAGDPNHRGKRFRIFNRDSLGYDGSYSDPLYKSIAFYMKQNLDNGTIAGFYYPLGLINAVDFGKESPFYTYVEINDGPIAFYIIPGNDYGEVLSSYCSITGLPAFPPLFSFGFFGSSMNYVESDDAPQRILNYFKKTEEKDLPCEGMYVSSGYLKAQDGKRYALYWNTQKFPNYGTYLSNLHDRGYNLTMNIKPGFLTTHPWYNELKEKGYFLQDDKKNTLVEFYWGGNASFLDFANPEARNWWKDKLVEKYLSHGCTGIWNDNNECELEDFDTDAHRRKLIYPLLMCQASWDAFKEVSPDTRPWIYTRSACPGIQKYARSWTGDNTSTWETLRYNQYQIMSLGLSAMPYIGNDLGGFYGERPSEELLVRSCQSAVFQPRFVIHSWRADDKPTEPWTYPNAFSYIRDLVLEHYLFMPYLYNVAYEASQTGRPMCRMLALEYPQDKNIPTNIACYQSGSSILSLFAVDESQDEIVLPLPENTCWYDVQKKTVLHGGKEYTFDLPFGKARYLFKIPSVIAQSPSCKDLSNGHFKCLNFMLVPNALVSNVLDKGSGACNTSKESDTNTSSINITSISNVGVNNASDYEYTYFEDDGTQVLSLNKYCLVKIRLSQNSAYFEVVKGAFPLDGRTITASLPDGFVFENNKNVIEIPFNEGKAKLDFFFKK